MVCYYDVFKKRYKSFKLCTFISISYIIWIILELQDRQSMDFFSDFVIQKP